MISQDYLQGYSAKGKLLSIGNNPYILGFGKENNYHSSEGVFHYSVNNYYIKLSSIKGQYDGAYKSDKEINISKSLYNLSYQIIFCWIIRNYKNEL